jgi:mRNA-degrading endonuclease RelE of RelBE toxin-antitoxin system
MRIIAQPRFLRGIKKLHPNEKAALDEAVRAIAANPEAGEAKKGDLAGVRVYKYRLGEQWILLAYRANTETDTLSLLAFGSHENFYRDLKR